MVGSPVVVKMLHSCSRRLAEECEHLPLRGSDGEECTSSLGIDLRCVPQRAVNARCHSHLDTPPRELVSERSAVEQEYCPQQPWTTVASRC